MDKDQRAAFLNSQSVCAMIEAMGMQADNKQREFKGEAVAYPKEAFDGLQVKYGISHNQATALLMED